MPKLAKIRLTGCQYDGLTKKHENSIFDLTKNGSADHTLFTLLNGGGKGVMMQLIFQLLLPETKWGKENGNKIISMFYDKRNNLAPFTFHVVLEWILDTVPEKRLITGIAMQAVFKNASNEEDEKTGLAYFLYTYEDDKQGMITLENLPLYDEKLSSAVDLELAEKFIDEHPRYFTKYSQSSVRRKDAPYYTYLESRGIYRSEWISLKSMNKSEGGVKDFFAGATDNKSIFDKVIIPVISDNIRNNTYEEENSLIEMFRSNLSITRDLPVLIKRQGDYKELLQAIKPLIENADSGSRFEDMRERCIDEGNDIYFILQEEETRVSQDIEKWEQEIKKAAQEGRELAFKKDNLLYNQERLELEAETRESRRLAEELAAKAQQKEENDAQLKLYRINEVLFNRHQTEAQLEQKEAEKQNLITVLNLQDTELRGAQLDKELEQEWLLSQAYWQNRAAEYFGYINHLNQELSKSRQQKKQYESKVQKLQNEINRFELKESELEKDARRLEKAGYDSLSLFYPERILADLTANKIHLEERIQELSDQITAYREQETVLTLDIKQLEYQYKSILGNQKELCKKALDREKDELELAKKVCRRLFKNYDGSLLNHAWFAGQLQELQEVDAAKQVKLKEVQQAIWEKSLDRVLNQEDYFMPNKDVALVKQEIARLDIYVETGAEYLKTLGAEEAEALLQEHPGFLYGVVIKSEKDWELIKKNISPELFLNNLVPVYIRAMMDYKEQEIFKTIRGPAFDLVNYSVYRLWQEKMDRNLEELGHLAQNLENDVREIRELQEDLNFIAKTDTAWILQQQAQAEEEKLNKLSEEIRNRQEEILGLKTRISQAEAELKTNNRDLAQLNDDIKQMEIYIEKVNELEKERVIIAKVQAEQQQLKETAQQLEDNIDQLDSEQRIIDKSYLGWKNSLEQILQSVKEVWARAEYQEISEADDINTNIPALSLGAEKLLSLVQAKKVLDADLAAKNTEIAVLNESIKHLHKDWGKYIQELQRISADWAEYPYLKLPLNELQITIDKLSQNKVKLSGEYRGLQSIYDQAKGSINTKAKHLEDRAAKIQALHKRAAVIEEIADINSAMNWVERDIQSNHRYAALCSETCQKNKDEKIKLDMSLNKIKYNYMLDEHKGKIDTALQARIQQNPDLVAEEWVRKYAKNTEQIDKTRKEGDDLRERFIKRIETLNEEQLRKKILTTIKEAKIANFKSNLDSFKSMENHFQQELNRLNQDKEKAEEVMRQWTHRAALHVLKMAEALKDMVAGMNYINEQGYAFPLVKLRGAEGLPRKEEDITHLLNEYFVRAIAEIIETKQDISRLTEQDLKEVMGDKVIFSKALQGRYPVLLVYKMSEQNHFRYARARDEYYTTWEAINKGEGYAPEGSGGQTLSVHTFVAMMLMNFKKKHVGNENPSTILILDNPFGQASTKHVLDPIFEIADKLNFQLICFAAPEIIKVEISERFPIFWELKIEQGKVVHGGRVIK